VKNDPPVVGRVLCSLEGVEFGRSMKGLPEALFPSAVMRFAIITFLKPNSSRMSLYCVTV
jgi:hypothetical protein